jgi:hypothetical protein
MDFYAGDFVEANMDISACTYKQIMQSANPSKRDENLSIWRDNLISIGLTDTDYGTSLTAPNVLHIYYPDHEGLVEGDGKDWLRVNFVTKTKAGKARQYNTSFKAGDGTGFVMQGSNVKPNVTANQHFRIDKNGVFWNHQKMDLSIWEDAADVRETFEKLLTANTLFVGSTQGRHRSRATYYFVRAVHNSVYNNATGGENSNFDDNPVNGGNL